MILAAIAFSLSLSPGHSLLFPSLSPELIEYAFSIHLSFACRLATGAFSAVEAGNVFPLSISLSLQSLVLKAEGAHIHTRTQILMTLNSLLYQELLRTINENNLQHIQ